MRYIFSSTHIQHTLNIQRSILDSQDVLFTPFAKNRFLVFLSWSKSLQKYLNTILNSLQPDTESNYEHERLAMWNAAIVENIGTKIHVFTEAD